jgi:Ca2+-binding EF-hand superfamily protein
MTKFFAAAMLGGLAAIAAAQTPPPAAATASSLSFDAWSTRARERLMALDTNHDGKISQEEFAARAGMMRGGAPASDGGAAPARDGSRMFARIDGNNDGSLDAAEINAMLARRFARMDANHDGVLTDDERQAMRGMNAPEQ